MKLRLTAAAMLSAGLLAGACGGQPSLPEAKPCMTPTATPALSPRASAFTVAAAYLNTMSDSSNQMKVLTGDFRARWPEGKFYRSDEFRPGFVDYAAGAGCIIDSLQALPLNLPSPSVSQTAARFAEAKPRFAAVLEEYQATFDFGLEAVRSRNVSQYRDFNRRLDEVTIRLDELITSFRNPRQTSP